MASLSEVLAKDACYYGGHEGWDVRGEALQKESINVQYMYLTNIY